MSSRNAFALSNGKLGSALTRIVLPLLASTAINISFSL